MRVLLTSEARFERTPDGEIWGPPAYGRALWARYLDVFSSVMIAARVANVTGASPGCVRASSADVQFCPLVPYSGLSGLLTNFPRVRASVVSAVQHTAAIIVRAPSPIAYLTSRAAARVGRPFAAEIVGDSDQVFSRGAFHHPLRVPIRWVARSTQQQLSREAIAVLYVTNTVLQRRYPSHGQAYAASDAALDDLAFASEDRPEWRPPAEFVLVTVGGLDQPYKGTGVLLDAVHELRRRGASVKLRVVGGGRLVAHYQRQCEALGLSPVVEFVGQQDRGGVRAALDAAHLFVLPSLTEGLPRALLEAMARGLPAVATNVGGVPELLPSECLVPPRDAHALAVRIEQMMFDQSGRRRFGHRNRAHARIHHERWQSTIRRDFFTAVRHASASQFPEARCA
jgi:glycosyltransferase involved in cell wall biosynthesis